MEELLRLLPLLEGIKTEDIVPERTAYKVETPASVYFEPRSSVETVLETVKQNAVDKLLDNILPSRRGTITDAGLVERDANLSKPRMPSVGDYTVKVPAKIPEGARVEEVGKGINKYDVLVGEDAPTWGIHGLVDFITGGKTDLDQRGRRRGGKIVPHPVTGYGAKAPEETEKFDSEAYQTATNAYNNAILTGNPLGDLVDTLNVLQSAGVTQANVNREQLVQDYLTQKPLIQDSLQQTGDFNLAYGEKLGNLAPTRARLQQTAANIAKTNAEATAALAAAASPQANLINFRMV